MLYKRWKHLRIALLNSGVLSHYRYYAPSPRSQRTPSRICKHHSEMCPPPSTIKFKRATTTFAQEAIKYFLDFVAAAAVAPRATKMAAWGMKFFAMVRGRESPSLDDFRKFSPSKFFVLTHVQLYAGDLLGGGAWRGMGIMKSPRYNVRWQWAEGGETCLKKLSSGPSDIKVLFNGRANSALKISCEEIFEPTFFEEVGRRPFSRKISLSRMQLVFYIILTLLHFI